KLKNKKLFAILTLVCFMFTLMPMAAFAGSGIADPETSVFEAVDGDQTVRLDAVTGVTADIEFEVSLFDETEEKGTTDAVYFWAVNEKGEVSSAMTTTEGKGSDFNNVFVVDPATLKDGIVNIQFVRTGVYTVYAALDVNGATKVSELTKLTGDSFSTITVKNESADPDYYTAKVEYAKQGIASAAVNPGVFKDADKEDVVLSVIPNNVASDDITVTFYGVDTKPLKKEAIKVETNSASIEVNKESITTNNQGEIKFTVAGSVEGDYEIDFTVDGVTWTLLVKVGDTDAAYIETVTVPTAPLAQFESLEDEVEFQITDINGNVVTAFDDGMDGIKDNFTEKGKYVVLTEKPADSDIVSKELGLKAEVDKMGNKTGVWVLTGLDNLDAEGTYAVKVILDNGSYATAKWEVKRFQTPVMLIIGTSTNVVELGATIAGELKYVDANGVVKAAKDAELVATGYAVAGVFGKANTEGSFSITAKSDEKYVGATITATAVSEKYDLVATKEFKVAEGASDIAFVDKTADVNVNNKLEWHVVDNNGTRVALMNGINANVKAEVNYVVLDKPADAKVSVTDKTVYTDLIAKGIGKMALTSNKVGNVTVQVILKAEYAATSNAAQQVKYYTGTQIFAVGTAGVGDVVVMSIGSNEIIINDAKATIDAAPIVENNRTFVPFRALAEAFGATVAYDEATQAVTAELNGVTVVMTIGSAEYTVNGVAKTADVAPFINGSRTMVPVRFAAEAFGIKVIPTYDENGATADILFNL
ncbi:MAG: copper amine oxidase N-terminal domain-containing protein, partial [Peptococcaceae bacterium]|nr:copper amine oxidase N-terminal domain-containing protein [Peptococcaceae bacterium]